MGKIIAFANQKGGVGKTTSAINCGAALARFHGKNVLLVDLDPQAHLTTSLGQVGHKLKNTIYETLKGEATTQDSAIQIGDLHLLPASIDLSAAENEFSRIPGREFLLKEAIGEIEQEFDYILIDCPPSLGLLTVNGFAAADEVYIPLQAEFLALHGMKQLLQVIEVVHKRLNDSLEITGIIGTMYDGRKLLNQEVIDKIKGYFGDKLFNTLIRVNVSLAEAPSFGQHIFDYRPGSAGADDYKALADEVIKRS